MGPNPVPRVQRAAMVLNRFKSILGLFALSSCTAVPPAHYTYGGAPVALRVASVPMSGGQFASIMLQSHNAERAAVGVPPLLWDDQMAASAASYARELAATGNLRHSPRSTRPGQGENWWRGARGAFPPHVMVGSWASEKSMFRPGIFPNVSRTGNWADVAHYTQMIWRDTTRLGCGIGSSSRFDVLVCRYSPKGNRDGRPVP